MDARAFTARSIGLGFLGIVLIAGFANFSDYIAQEGRGALAIGNHLPVAPFVYLAILLLLVNGVLGTFLPGLVLRSKELLVTFCMTLVACFPPTSGLMRYLLHLIMRPWHDLSTSGKASWERFRLFEHLDERLYPQPAPQLDIDGKLIAESMDPDVYGGYYTGLSVGNENIAFSDVPWAAWGVPVLMWGLIIGFLALTILALSLVVHRQWAHHEQLTYPLAQVGRAMVTVKPGNRFPDVFTSKLFWSAFIPVFLIYMLSYLNQWASDYVPALEEVLPNVKYWQSGLSSKFPILQKADGFKYLDGQFIFFCVIGLAYFVSSDISLTMGLSSIVMVAIGVVFYSSTGTPLMAENVEASRVGAYVGFALVLLFTGRRYYGAILAHAIGWKKGVIHDEYSVFAARFAMLSFTGFLVMLILVGIDFWIALCFALLLLLMFLVISRVVCETGIPFIQSGWFPGVALAYFFGPAALGAGPLVLLYYLGVVFAADPRESLMPYVATSLKVADDSKVKLKKLFVVMTVSVFAALAVAFVAKMYMEYNVGMLTKTDAWASAMAPQIPFNRAASELNEMRDLGLVEQSDAARGFGKLLLISPNGQKVSYIAIGLFAVVALSMMRFRFTKFPIHPVLFLMLGTYPASSVWFSFLVGWFIKSLVTKFGGGRVYQNLKPLFIGLIAAELMVAGIAILVALLVYFFTGNAPNIWFNVLPT